MKAEYTDPMFKIGCEQDILVGACRGAVKMIRQKAGIATAGRYLLSSNRGSTANRYAIPQRILVVVYSATVGRSFRQCY